MRLTRNFGIWMIVIGVAMQFLNILTYGLWGIDIDIWGALIFIVGLVITIVNWKKKKEISKKRQGKKKVK